MKIVAGESKDFYDLLDIAGTNIPAYSWDTETQEAEVFVFNADGALINVKHGESIEPLLVKVKIPDARLIKLDHPKEGF